MNVDKTIGSFLVERIRSVSIVMSAYVLESGREHSLTKLGQAPAIRKIVVGSEELSEPGMVACRP